MRNILISLTDEQYAAIEAARGTSPRSPWLENELRKLPSIKKACKSEGIVLPDRPADARGGDRTKGP